MSHSMSSMKGTYPLIVRLHMVDEDFAWRLVQELVKIDSSDPGCV